MLKRSSAILSVSSHISGGAPPDKAAAISDNSIGFPSERITVHAKLCLSQLRPNRYR